MMENYDMDVVLGTVAPVGFEDFADPQWLQTLKQLGCTTAQVYRNHDPKGSANTSNITLQQVQDYLTAAELPCDSLHGIYGHDLDVSSPDESRRNTTVDKFKSEGEFVLQLGGKIVVVHCSDIHKDGVAADERALRISQLRKTIEQLAAFGKSIGVRYAFENLPGYHPVGNDVAELAGLLREVNSPAAGMCFDVAHANLTGDPITAISDAGETMIYIHACDNHGTVDEHLVPMLGNIDWHAVAAGISQQNYRGVIMLEAFAQLDELKKLADMGWAEKLSEFLTTAQPKFS
ncbi:MAG: sugar phosphate isomerase/epimerase [Phycisphaerae bacterium]|nr:sugar phosphate isomerase/epimerase [Phycisphaerae bacterium]